MKPPRYPDNFWMEFINPATHCCGICGNTGVIDTRERVFTPANTETGIRAFCICPNGRGLKEHGADIEKSQTHCRPGGFR